VTELVYTYLPTHMCTHVSHSSKVNYATKKTQGEAKNYDVAMVELMV